MVREQRKKVMRYEKPGGRGEAALVYDTSTGTSITVSGSVRDALEARAFQDAATNGELPIPECEVEVEQSRPRRGRGGAPLETKPDADSMSPAELADNWEQLFAARALDLSKRINKE